MRVRAGRRGGHFRAILKQRCPRCLRGRVFAGIALLNLMTMNEHCSECGLKFEPVPGYFAGAMYLSYGMAVALSAPLTLLLLLLGLPDWIIMFATAFELSLFLPFVFRYSRVVWLHLDQFLSPR